MFGPRGYGCLLRAHRLHFVSSAADIPEQLLSFIMMFFIPVFKGPELQTNNNSSSGTAQSVQPSCADNYTAEYIEMLLRLSARGIGP